MTAHIPSHIRDFFAGSHIPLALSDPSLPDDPMVLGNAPFYEMTGYEPDEVIGQNCRFLQGKSTLPSSRNTIRGDFAARRDTKVLIRNYRKSGEEFDNFLYIFTLYDEHDTPAFRIGSQFEVPTVHRAKAFESYAKTLSQQVDALNTSGAASRSRLIDVGELVGLSVKTLLQSRLDNLRAV